MKKRLFALGLAAVMSFSLAACGGSDSSDAASSAKAESTKEEAKAESSAAASDTKEEAASDTKEEAAPDTEKTVKIGHSSPNMAAPYFNYVVLGMQAAARDYNAEVIIHDAQDRADTQLTAYENFKASGCDAISSMPVNYLVLTDICNTLLDEGVVLGQYVDTLPGSFYMSTDNIHEGQVFVTPCIDWINEELGGKAEVLLCSIDDGEDGDNVIRMGSGKATIEEACPDATIVDWLKYNTTDEMITAVENALTAHPNIKVVMCGSDAYALAVAEVFAAAGKAAPDVMVCGCEGTMEAYDAIKDPDNVVRATNSFAPYRNGYEMVKALCTIVRGGTAENLKQHAEPVTIENVDEYIAEMQEWDKILSAE